MCHGMMIETGAAECGRTSIGRLYGEPELSDLLHDPIARALMAADKVDSGEVYALLRRARHPAASGGDAG
jgi:hypothetical protein